MLPRRRSAGLDSSNREARLVASVKVVYDAERAILA
jgi:hypothetical protein